jgi:hypothetical protein
MNNLKFQIVKENVVSVKWHANDLLHDGFVSLWAFRWSLALPQQTIRTSPNGQVPLRHRLKMETFVKYRHFSKRDKSAALGTVSRMLVTVRIAMSLLGSYLL